MPGQGRNAAVRAGEVERVGDYSVISKIAYNQNDGGILRPNHFGHGLEFFKVVVIHVFLVAQFDVFQTIWSRMTVGDTLFTPFAVRSAIEVIHEIGHVLRRLVDVEVGNAEKTRRFAEVQEIENAPSV